MQQTPVRRRRRLRLWLVLTVIALVAFGALSAIGLYSYATGDNTEFMDGRVEARADRACGDLAVGLRALSTPAAGSADARAQRLRAEADLMRELVQQVKAVGASALANDIPSEAWLADWTALAAARQQYADQVRGGVPGATMHEPQTPDGYPISRRMKDSGPASCAVLDQLAKPLP